MLDLLSRQALGTREVGYLAFVGEDGEEITLGIDLAMLAERPVDGLVEC